MVSMQNYSQEELKSMPMIELANLILFDEKEAIHFKEVFDKVAEIKEFPDEQKLDLIAQFYTDLNIDGRFVTTGDNLWGLKRWYPVEQIDEQVSNPSKRKKKAKTEEDDDLDIVDDEVDDLIDEFDAEEDEEVEGFDEDKEDDFPEMEEEEFPAYTDEDDE